MQYFKNCRSTLEIIKQEYQLTALPDRPFPTITLIGSTKYRDVWEAAQRELSMTGWIVHTVGLFGHLEQIDMAGPIKKLLDKVYLQKIRMSNCVMVLNREGYIGLGACDEICYAISLKIPIVFLESIEHATGTPDLYKLIKLESNHDNLT